MSIKFKVIFSTGNFHFVEYIFDKWNNIVFDMIHYNEQGSQIDSKTVVNITPRKAMKQLIVRGRLNGAEIKIVERNSSIKREELNILIFKN